jgi:hypothetical protein
LPARSWRNPISPGGRGACISYLDKTMPDDVCANGVNVAFNKHSQIVPLTTIREIS